jgi:hypothetical protein
MISGMMCRNSNAFAAMYVICLAGSLTAGTAVQPSLANQSTPELKIRVYDFPGLPNGTLREAYLEATRMLKPVPIHLKWVECTLPALSSECTSPQLASDMTVRVVAKVLPPATATALGLAAWSGDDAAAFIFYDRAMALRTSTRSISSILGRVMAHEITHLLLGSQDHAEVGLMRGQWTADDLRIASSACLWLTASSVQSMQKEAVRRVFVARNVAALAEPRP